MRGQVYCNLFMATAYTPTSLTDKKGIDFGNQAIKLAEMELKAAQALAAGRCRAFERSEVARAQSLLTTAYQAVGSAKTMLGAA